MKNLLIAFLVVAGIFGYLQNNPDTVSSFAEETVQSDQTLADAYKNQLSGIQVHGSAEVSHILRDDNKGSRHQRFILRLPSGQTVLVAHNIDLAPRISNLNKGDRVQYFGQYEWNAKGGVLHWTHHDPKGRHVGGWLKHEGQTYQ
ncbi:DUF3465 domain-containing protein [Marinobacter sp. ANT_B65]|uniref:DUF3465 domain-containing protein n=1 Tax=Marinobacter sp. ANT_B65 TaxID=2039467 RepID=UPI000BBEDE92|nr:DUF3465 domain-containing protein [Marinobacter sp. ANT_B65]PCM46134.1 hypothetical protein CPA50_09370 [Marinobacter sp. ANT_B65]